MMERIVGSSKCWGALACLVMLEAVDQQAAWACDVANHRYVLDPAEQVVDVHAPETPIAGPVAVKRGRNPNSAGCGPVSSCDDLGTITLSLQASDDRTAATDLGYRLTVVRGRAPDGLFGQGRDVRSYDGTTVYLHWVDLATDDQEDLDFDLEVRALDRGGNVSAGAATITVRSEGGGCRLAGSRSRATASAAVLLFALVAVVVASGRRRRA